MVSKLGFDGCMPDSQIRSESRGGIEIPRQLAGKARVLYELAAGESGVPGEEPSSGYNPQGEVGCDQSGPPWGSAFLHPIAVWSGLADDSDVHQPASDLVCSFNAGLLIPVVMHWRLWVKPFEPNLPGAEPPYSRAQVWVRGHRFSGAGAATLHGRARNKTLNETFQTEMTGVAGATTASTAEVNLFSSAAFYVRLMPGVNDIVLTFICATAAHAIQLDAVSLLQVAKRSH